VLDELKATLSAQDSLTAAPSQLDEILLAAIIDRVDNKQGPIPGPRFFSLGELDNLYSAMEFPPQERGRLQELNDRLAESVSRLQVDGCIMHVAGHPSADAMTVTTKGRERAAQETTRRLSAVLNADIVGYSRLIERDEDGTLAHLRALRTETIDPIIHRHHGRLFKTMGDGLLVEFASVVEAVRCAILMQSDIERWNLSLAPEQRLIFRIGINHGEVVVQGDDLLGDVINIASRIQTIAMPGGICIAARVEEDVRGKLEVSFEDLGEHAVKNIARPIRIYRAHLGRGTPGPASAPVVSQPRRTQLSQKAERPLSRGPHSWMAR
jgi:class 3 adenylate cyclase